MSFFKNIPRFRAQTKWKMAVALIAYLLILSGIINAITDKPATTTTNAPPTTTQPKPAEATKPEDARTSLPSDFATTEPSKENIAKAKIIPDADVLSGEAGAVNIRNNSEKDVITTTPMMGAFLGSWSSVSKRNIEYYNKLTNYHTDLIHTFVNTNQDMTQWKSVMDYVHNQGAKNLLTLMPQKSDDSDYNTVDINNGLLDAYFIKIAKQIKSWQSGSEIWIRPMHEVNGSWSGWCIGNSKVNTNISYKAAFQRIVKIFRANGASNAKFIYNVNYINSGRGASFMGAYPGDDYVDYVSMDGYNWGTTQSWSKWQGFRQIFDNAYTALTNGSNKPVIIAEVASTEVGGNKAAWITDMKKQIQSGAYPKLVATIWFNVKKETDWRIESSTSSLTAYQN